MSMVIVLETESGDQVRQFADSADCLRRLIERVPMDDFRVLRYIDWDGDTLINQIQLEDFVRELGVLSKHTDSVGESRVVDVLLEFAKLCEEDLLYIKFYGD